MQTARFQNRTGWLILLGLTAAIAVVTALAPVERTLGGGARLVYFHGAWVWTGKLAFAAAGICGLFGLVFSSSSRGRRWQQYSVACALTGMFFWLTYLPLSLWVQQANWGGIFWDEPRWRIPLIFGIVGLLLQIGLFLIEKLWAASLANLLFAAALWFFLGGIQNVLHPDSPIFQSDSVRIQGFFLLLVLLSIAFGAVLARILFLYIPESWK